MCIATQTILARIVKTTLIHGHVSVVQVHCFKTQIDSNSLMIFQAEMLPYCRLVVHILLSL